MTETGVPLSTTYRYLKRFWESDGQIESLADKSSVSHTHLNGFTFEQKDTVIDYKQKPPHKIALRQIATELIEVGMMNISYHSVADILKQRGVTHPPFRSVERTFIGCPRWFR